RREEAGVDGAVAGDGRGGRAVFLGGGARRLVARAGRAHVPRAGGPRGMVDAGGPREWHHLPVRLRLVARGPAGPSAHRARWLVAGLPRGDRPLRRTGADDRGRSEEHTSELQSREKLVCRLLLEKKKLETIAR